MNEGRYANLTALMAAIRAGEIDQSKIVIFIDNDSVPFIGPPADAEEEEFGAPDLLASDLGPEGMLREALELLGFTEFES